jgi:Domain of unknown function (DUF927)
MSVQRSTSNRRAAGNGHGQLSARPAIAAVPDGPPAPPDGARRVPGSTDWAYVPGVAVWRFMSRDDGRWVKQLAWCPEVADAVRYPSQDGHTITRSFKITVGDRTEVVSAGDLLRGVAWPKFAVAAGFTGRQIADVLVNIVTDQASQLPDVIGYPYFHDGLLQLPPAEYLPDGYTHGEGSTRAALSALTAAVAPYPVAALQMGLSALAPWVGALQSQPFTLHTVGDSTVGKSTALYACASLWGIAYRRVAPPWAGTKIGIPGSFRDLGVLPAFRDELGTGGLPPADRAALFTLIMEGCRRTARTRDDLARPSASWESVCFSTGNIAAVPASHASAGTPKGLIEIHADGTKPVIPAEAKARVRQLTNAPEAAGAWVPYATRLPLEDVRAEVERAAKDLGDPDADGLEWHMHRAMSLALAGARILAGVTGVPELAASAERAARAVIADTEDRLAEIGADHGARLAETVAEQLAAHPSAFGLGEISDRIEQIGFLSKTQDGTELVCIYRFRHAEIARRAEVEDATAALRQLRESGQIVTSAGQGLKYRARRDGRLVSVIAYKLSAETGQNTKNTKNIPGQSDDFCSDQGPEGQNSKSEHAPPEAQNSQSEHAAGPSLAADLPWTTADDRAPCVLCGEPTVARVGGEPRHWADGCQSNAQTAATGPAALDGIATAAPAPEPVAASSGPPTVRIAGRMHAAVVCAGCGELAPAAYAPNGYHVICAPDDPDSAAGSVRDALAAVADITADESSASARTTGPPEPSSAEPSSAEPEPVERQDHGPAGAVEPEPSSARRKVADMSADDELAAFARALRKPEQYPDAGDGDLANALAIFHKVTDGGRWVSFAGQTGQALFARLVARYPSMTAPAAVMSDRAREVWESGVQTRANFTGKGHKFRPGQWFTGYDINGQFPAAAGSAKLGDGEPVVIERPRTLDGLLNLPGYVELARSLRTGHSAFGTLAAGAWLPMPFVKFLAGDLGLTVPAAVVLYWPKHGRRLAMYVKHAYREPREQLAAMPDSMPVRLAMAALKDQANAFIGMLRSEKHSHGGNYRPDWYDIIVATAEANALRAFGKCDVQPVAKIADTAYWVAESAPCTPAGLQISPQLGKWKLERWGLVTAEFVRGYKAGEPRTLHEAAKVADTERREQ